MNLDALAADPARVSLLCAEDRAKALAQVVALMIALGSPAVGTDRLVSVREAAHLLGCSQDALYRNKRHPARVQNGRSVRYSVQAIERYIAQRRGRG